MMSDFVAAYSEGKSKIKDSTLILKKVSQTSPNEITMDFETPYRENLQGSLAKAAVRDLMVKIIRSNRKNIRMLDQGVNFKINLFATDDSRIISEIVNKTSLTKITPETTANESTSQLNQLLEISNNNLPVTDSATGIKIIKVTVGSDHDIIYTAAVPTNFQKSIQMPENQKIIKQNMLQDQSFEKMVKSLKKFDVEAVKYQYKDQNGKLLQEVTVKETDFK